MNIKTTAVQRKQIAKMYEIGEHTTEQIAVKYNISARQVQRIAKSFGVLRTAAQSNKAIVHLKDYSKRKNGKNRSYLPIDIRYSLLTEHPYCSICGRTADDDIQLEIDHRDEDPSNNMLENLWVLCDLCNKGKSWRHRKCDIMRLMDR